MPCDIIIIIDIFAENLLICKMKQLSQMIHEVPFCPKNQNFFSVILSLVNG